ncbi:hypothetical protein [Myxococcus sp. AB036A]|uniref:hypothetical protein n=1 Tax=Myxococcus sp. AB036A TaxID=2562793 RepID=UPI001E3DCD8E|nr:hypothetical protein [Myxococcus sp. AB036A]
MPLGHGSAFFSALCARVPSLHARADLGVFTLRGERAAEDALHLMGCGLFLPPRPVARGAPPRGELANAA